MLTKIANVPRSHKEMSKNWEGVYTNPLVDDCVNVLDQTCEMPLDLFQSAEGGKRGRIIRDKGMVVVLVRQTDAERENERRRDSSAPCAVINEQAADGAASNPKERSLRTRMWYSSACNYLPRCTKWGLC